LNRAGILGCGFIEAGRARFTFIEILGFSPLIGTEHLRKALAVPDCAAPARVFGVPEHLVVHTTGRTHGAEVALGDAEKRTVRAWHGRFSVGLCALRPDQTYTTMTANKAKKAAKETTAIGRRMRSAIVISRPLSLPHAVPHAFRTLEPRHYSQHGRWARPTRLIHVEQA